MKTVLLGLLLVLSATVFAQTAPGIQWQKCYGGSSADAAQAIIPTSDGGYITAGYSFSKDGDVTGHHGTNKRDFWIVKLSAAGSIQWQKSLGGNGEEIATAIQQTTDGGYIVVGYAYSNNGDVTGHHGLPNGSDYWVVKLTAAGDIQWKKCLGGSYDEQATSVQVTGDGGFIITGWSNSMDGDITGRHGIFNFDAWVVKLTSAGAIEWQKSLGGSGDEYANAVQVTADGGYIVAGSSTSNDGDVSGHHGITTLENPDCWIVKLTHNGVIEWQKSLGGTKQDKAYAIQLTGDGGYIVAGFSDSNDGDVSGHHGTAGTYHTDYWVVKLTHDGMIQWQKSLAGSSYDVATSVQVTADGGYIAAGWSNSDDGDVSNHHGLTSTEDYWVVKLNSTGDKIWEKSLGGTDNDECRSIALAPGGGYIVAGGSGSNNGDVTGNHGGDFWVVKLNNGKRINITADKDTIAGGIISIPQGTPVTFSAAIDEGITSPVYQWKRNNTNVGTNSATYADSTLVTGDSIFCILTGNGKTDTSNAIKFKTYLGVDITANTSDTICDGTPVTFTATVTGIQSPSYQWKKNSTDVGTNNATYVDSTLATGESIYCVVTSTSRIDTSNVIHFTVYANYQPVISIQGRNAICDGQKVLYQAAVTNAGTNYHLQWKKNGIDVGSDSLNYTTTSLQNNDSIWCVVTSNTGCTVSPVVASNKITVRVNDILTPTVTAITTPRNYQFCATSTSLALTFFASIKNGGTAPFYQWKKNGIDVGTNSSTYTDNALHNGDSVWCVYTSSGVCVTVSQIASNKILIAYSHSPAPTVTVVPSPAGMVCTGTTVRFKASVKNGGTAQHYQWKKNGLDVGSDNDTYTDGLLANDDSIWCIFTSNAVCVVNNPVTSDKIKQVVNSAAPVKPSAISGPVAVFAGQLNNSYSVSDVSYVTYTWIVPASCTIVAGQGANNITVNWGSATGGIIVRAKNACGQSDSSKLLVHVTSFFSSGAADDNTGSEDALKTAGKEGIQLYPNPAVNTAYISFTSTVAGKYFVQVTDAQGRIMQTKETNAVKGNNKVTIDVSHYAQGVYFVRIAGANRQQSLRLLIQR